MAISDMIVSFIMKKGILYEARNVDIELTFPREDKEGNPKEVITAHFKADHMQLKLEKEGKEEV
jgi:hypothetical protein